MNMMPNQQGPQQGPQPTQAQLRAAVQQQITQQQQLVHQQQIQQQQLQQQQLQHSQQQQQSVSQSPQQQPQQPHQPQSSAIYIPQSVIPQQIMIQQNAQTFAAMPNGGNFIQMTPFGKKQMMIPNEAKGPRNKVILSSAGPQLQPINSFVTGQSPQPIGNQYYTLQPFPSQGGPVQGVNSATLLSPNNHQYLFTVSQNAFQNQPIVFNQNSVPISVGNTGASVISLAHTQSQNVRTATKTTASGPNNGQPCLIAPATPVAATTTTPLTTQRLKTIKPATENNRASIGTQTATATGQIVPGTPITIPIHLQQHQIHQQQHIQLQLQPQSQQHQLQHHHHHQQQQQQQQPQPQPQSQSNPPTKSSKAIQSTNISNKDRSSNLDTVTTVTLVPQRNTIGNTTTPNNTNVNKPTSKSNKLIATNAPLKEKVIQSPKKKATTTATDTVDLVDHCSDTNNLSNGVNNKTNGSKSPQRAIVKPYINDPNVLTHVIDGFVIQESQQPFQVNSEDTITDPIDEDNNTITSAETQTPKTKASNAVCENCQKTISKVNKKKKFKRFCSNMCAKKSNNNLINNNNNSSNSNNLTDDGNKNGSEDFEMSDVQQGEIIESSKQSSQPTSKKLKTDLAPNCKVTESTEPLDSSIDGGYIPAGGSNPNLWNVQDVYDFVRHLPGCQEYADEFKSQEIDGQALMLLKEDHLMSAMNMKLGPALKICSRITSLFKAEANKSQA